MKYDVYFHNDFDGRASAAVMLNFLESRGDGIENFLPVDFGIKSEWHKLDPENPFIVVDFLYHPRAAFWFDHHQTTFLKKEWEKNFRPDKWHVLDAESPSACGLVLKSLANNFGYNPPKHIKELARWLDVVDMAGFRSAKQTIEKKESALRLEEMVDYKKGDGKLTVWLIKKLSAEPMAKIVADKKIKKILKILTEKRKKSLDFYKKNIVARGKLVYIDISKSRIPELRFAPYYFYPEAVYALLLKAGNENILHLRVGVNPWRRSESEVHIGEFMKKHFGGGGHKVVGGAEFVNRSDAENAIRVMADFLNFKNVQNG